MGSCLTARESEEKGLDGERQEGKEKVDLEGEREKGKGRGGGDETGEHQQHQPKLPPPLPPPPPLPSSTALAQPSPTPPLESPPEVDIRKGEDAKQTMLPVSLVETRLMLAEEALVSYEKREEEEREREMEGGQEGGD